MKRVSSSRLALFTEQTHRKLTDLHPPDKGIITSIPTAEHVNDTELVASLPDAHVAYLLLRHCASAQRIAFLMRNVDPASTELFLLYTLNGDISDLCMPNKRIALSKHPYRG
ncbi:hypothetical protein GJ496_002675 [Pomphorhynchus laevis]|nr:hypothetical protein GJ496_002675 [Pomphorhynchus laevis]